MLAERLRTSKRFLRRETQEASDSLSGNSISPSCCDSRYNEYHHNVFNGSTLDPVTASLCRLAMPELRQIKVLVSSV